MAAENEIQFFEAPFQYSIWEFSSNVNLTYHKLINTTPIKLPMMNTGFETPFSQSDAEKWDKSYFAIRKRKWFVMCPYLDKFIKDTIEDYQDEHDMDINTNYIITDTQIVNWRRFLMACDSEYKNQYIFTQRPWRYIWCDPQPQDACKWIWEHDKKDVYETSQCAFHKFQKITTLQANEKRTVDWLYIWNITVEWWTTTSVLFNESRTAIEWVKTWDFIQIQDSPDWDIVVWQALQLWTFDNLHWWYNMWYGSWVWIIDKDVEEVKDERWEKYWDLWIMWPVNVQLYDWAKLWISFAWWNWVYEWDWMEFNLIRQTEIYKWVITSLTEDMDWLIYTTSKWLINFLRPHTDSWQSLWWTIYSTNPLYWWWDLAKSCWDYVFLFWPSSMWIAYKDWTDERWDFRWNVQILDRNMWYWDKEAVMVYNEWLYMVDNNKRFVKLDLEVTKDSYYRPSFKITPTDMSLHWINTDLRNLSSERWDKVYLYKWATKIYIIIQDNKTNEQENTKILVYEDELKYWHWRYLCWLDVRWYHWWVWFWKGLFNYQWNYDCAKYKREYDPEDDDDRLPNPKIPFKEIISLTFWDTSWFTWKELLWIKAAVWYHSYISNDTTFALRTDWWWFSKTIKMNTLYTSAYVKAINELHKSWKTDFEWLENIYYKMPIGIWIYSWNWVWLIDDIERSAKKEFDAYCWYHHAADYKKDTCCDAKPGSEPSGNGCTMEVPKPDAQNFWSDRLQYHFNVAKFSTVPIDIGQQWQNFYIELVADNYDSIEFLWFMIWWMFMDNNFDSVANKPYYQTTPEDSLPWMMWK